ncbi:PDZ domain-containing protein [Sphingobium aquiterrae]|uniref:PDZ domain-containing protein n=1 Tax=Sphingobium aquiterrae TaxID=2038656 RepID=UPI003018825B
MTRLSPARRRPAPPWAIPAIIALLLLCLIAGAILLALHGDGERHSAASQRLGMTFEIMAAGATAPILVTSLRDNGLAGRAGVRVGDRIARINGSPADTLRQARERLDHAAALHLAIERSGQPLFVDIANAPPLKD